MEPNAAHPAPSRSFGLACALVGVDPGLMATCPPRDRDGVWLLAALMLLVWLWQSVVFTAVAHLMLAEPGEIRPDLIAAAGLLATIILLLDACVVMRPSWTGLGYEELRRGGLTIRLPVLTRLKGGVFPGLRLALSAVVGTLVALFVSLLVYGKDIAGQRTAEHAARNAPLIAAATRVVDDRLARSASAQADLRARIAAADRTADSLRRSLAEHADPALAGAAAELARLERARELAEARVERQQRRGAASGLARARRQLDGATGARDAARARLNEAEGRALTLAQGRDTALTNQLAALEAQRRGDLDRLTAAEAEQRAMLDGRAAAIQAAVAADPAYVAPGDGLLDRLRALKALTADPWVAAVVFLLEVFFAGIELAAVFAKLLCFVPATYATRLAQDDQFRQVATAREIKAFLGAPEETAARPARAGDAPAPGTLMAAEAPSGPPFEEPLTSADAASDGADRGAPDTLMAAAMDGTGEHPPRRRRGRPPKAR